jgi:hypothetical protein
MRGFLGVMAVVLFAASAMAGPLAPCIRAASSASGSFLVITDAEYPHPLPAAADRVTLRVVPKQTFAGDTLHKVSSPSTYWISGGWNGWSVQIEQRDNFMSSCPISILSDDGEYLILLNSTPWASPNSAMRIYRRAGEGHKGILVKDIGLKDIWPEKKWQEWRNAGWTDETPEWFAGGSFAFSSDSRTLIHKTSWGNTVHISLADGSVSPK